VHLNKTVEGSAIVAGLFLRRLLLNFKGGMIKLDNYEEISITSNEKDYLDSIYDKLRRIKHHLNNDFNKNYLDYIDLYDYLFEIKKITGNIHNDISFIACLMVKEFLRINHNLLELDVAAKAQGASGLDIDKESTDGKRIIGEIKTTSPYKNNDLGSSQRKSFFKDFKKLENNTASYKYFFVTELKTFEIVKRKYLNQIPNVKLVLLPDAIDNPDDYIVGFKDIMDF
jgi:hypothetical protein